MPSLNLHGESESQYAIVIDAGSSGSRVYVFEWPDPTKMIGSPKITQVELQSLPDIKHDPKWTKKISPGISSYVTRKDDIWADHLLQLVEHAEAIVPGSDHGQTPIFFMATAGMRLLSDSDQKDLLGRVCSALQHKTNFYIESCSSNVRIINGEEEGLYGWLALNYLSKTITMPPSSSSAQNIVTHGFLDMGGASAQIAFAPNQTETSKHMEDLYNVNLRTLNGDDHKMSVFISTWLGFGANEARTRLSQKLASDGKTTDPCLPQGLSIQVPLLNQTELITIEGLGEFKQCLEEMEPLLNKHLPCVDEPCLFNGVHVPALDFETNKFVGVSEYWYTAHDIFGIGGTYDFEVYEKKAREFCDLTWDEIVANSDNNLYNGISKDKLETACFKATWIMNVLHEGFGVPLDGAFGKNLDHVENKYGSEPFEGIFSSASHINGVEMSWPLGKAILYASSRVPAKSGSSDVGYFPAAISGESGFISGGLTDLSNRNSNDLLNSHSTGSGTNILAAVFYFLVVIVLFAFFAHRRRFLLIMKRSLPGPVRSLLSPVLKTSSFDTDSGDRLLEEGMAMGRIKSPFISRVQSTANIYEHREPKTPPSGHLHPTLGTSTSMIDLKSGFMISREGSRMSLRSDNLRPASSSSDEESSNSK